MINTRVCAARELRLREADHALAVMDAATKIKPRSGPAIPATAIPKSAQRETV